MNKAALIFLTLCLAGLPARAETDNGPTATARFLEGSAMTGGTANLAIDFTLPPGARLPDPPQVRGLGDRKALAIRPTDQGLELTLLVDSLDRFEAPALIVPFVAADGSPGTVRSEPVSLSVDNGLPENPENEEIAPVKDIVPTGNQWFKPLAWAGCVFAFLALVLGVWWFLRSRRRVQEITAQVLPHVRATENLDRLARALEEGRLEDKAFYFGLSLAVREYMGGIRPFPAPEMTTEEIATAAGRAEDREMVRMLREADLVKFAGHHPLASRKKEHLASAYGYIRDTAPVGPENKAREEEAS
ncbi:MAG: hypothetical protein KKA60_10475 [Proteobacteria bacterium]|nr:hypothetical protein [Pseudomonadota bacterium]